MYFYKVSRFVLGENDDIGEAGGGGSNLNVSSP
jgi:hypothetical protein